MDGSETYPVVNGEDKDDDEFNEIPTLPRGHSLLLRLLSNWGDTSYVGMAGIEVFLESGRRAKLGEVTTSTTAHEGSLQSIGDLSAFGKSSWRAAINTQGVSRDNSGSIRIDRVSISMKIEEDESIAMIRIWNYNESRVHSTRGVRELEILLDGRRIFKGIVSPAFIGDEGDHGETILFTTSDRILEAISQNDVCLLPQVMDQSLNIRPGSAVNRIIPQRPLTAEVKTLVSTEELEKMTQTKKEIVDGYKTVKVIHLECDTTWGMGEYIGLTGVEFFDVNGEAIDKNDIVSVTVDGGTGDVTKLINGRNLTRSPDDMWLSPFDPTNPPTITFTLARPLQIAGVSVWNYNGNVEMSYAGVRSMRIHMNGRTKRRVVLRKATGYVYFDFVQDINFDRCRNESRSEPGDRPASKSASGFIYQLCLLSAWNDEYYIGLNGIELRDGQDQPIRVRPQNLAAFPESVNILPQVKDDPRRSENLINGINDREGAEHSWLTPQLPNRCARVFFVFDKPTSVSKLIIYNYRKTPGRGVRHMSISVDDDIIWSGEIPMCSADESGILEITLRE